uniref:Putative tail protein n=1 Tax=viral metagenome TaxID=1070528 RepID=A0A6M3KVN1_9ZZZZ
MATNHVSGKNGAVYKGTTAALEIDSCEVIWTADDAAVSRESDVPVPEGTYYARATTTTVGADAILIHHAVVKDLSAYDGAMWWARTGLAAGTTAADLKLKLYEVGGEAAPTESLVQPALVDNVWKHCFDLFSDTPANRNAIVGVQLYQDVDLGDDTFDLDDIVAVAEIDGIKSWSLEYTSATLETTDFGDSGVATHIPGISSWSGSFDGFKDGVPVGIGAEVYLVMGETNTDGNWWLGKAIITSARPSVDHDGIVTYSYDFQGTGELTPPTA